MTSLVYRQQIIGGHIRIWEYSKYINCDFKEVMILVRPNAGRVFHRCSLTNCDVDIPDGAAVFCSFRGCRFPAPTNQQACSYDKWCDFDYTPRAITASRNPKND
jgi:hypothetical protein